MKENVKLILLKEMKIILLYILFIIFISISTRNPYIIINYKGNENVLHQLISVFIILFNFYIFNICYTDFYNNIFLNIYLRTSKSKIIITKILTLVLCFLIIKFPIYFFIKIFFKLSFLLLIKEFLYSISYSILINLIINCNITFLKLLLSFNIVLHCFIYNGIYFENYNIFKISFLFLVNIVLFIIQENKYYNFYERREINENKNRTFK